LPRIIMIVRRDAISESGSFQPSSGGARCYAVRF
jgi:hypothetical protein